MVAKKKEKRYNKAVKQIQKLMLYIASDHGGFKFKTDLIDYLKNELKINIEDLGPFSYDKDDDYPDYVIPLAKKVSAENSRGIVICRNGVGVSIAVNKVKGIRAGIGYNLAMVKSMIEDDNTNILALAADYISIDEAKAIAKKWLKTKFSGEERHMRRLKKIEKIDN